MAPLPLAQSSRLHWREDLVGVRREEVTGVNSFSRSHLFGAIVSVEQTLWCKLTEPNSVTHVHRPGIFDQNQNLNYVLISLGDIAPGRYSFFIKYRANDLITFFSATLKLQSITRFESV